MLPEQIWDAPDLPEQGHVPRASIRRSAMPLAWAHAEYIKLLRSGEDGEVFDRVEPVHSRYRGARRDLPIEICKRDHLLTEIASGKNDANYRMQSFPGDLDPGRMENTADTPSQNMWAVASVMQTSPLASRGRRTWCLPCTGRTKIAGRAELRGADLLMLKSCYESVCGHSSHRASIQLLTRLNERSS